MWCMHVHMYCVFQIQEGPKSVWSKVMINELAQILSEGKREVILEDRNDSYEDIKRRIEEVTRILHLPN
jgi:hypothetical protein